MFQFLRGLGVLCDHKLDQVGTGYDDIVKCRVCKTRRNRRPGEVTEVEKLEHVVQKERERQQASSRSFFY